MLRVMPPGARVGMSARAPLRGTRAAMHERPKPSLLRPNRFSPRASRLRTSIERGIEQLPQRLQRTSTPQRMLYSAAGGMLFLLIIRWHAILRAATPPALALAATGWVLAHDRCAAARRARLRDDAPPSPARAQQQTPDARDACSREALQDDLAVLLRPQRPRRRALAPPPLALPRGDFGAEEDEEEEEEVGPWDGGFKLREVADDEDETAYVAWQRSHDPGATPRR
jgi:hypothetical protein